MSARFDKLKRRAMELPCETAEEKNYALAMMLAHLSGALEILVDRSRITAQDIEDAYERALVDQEIELSARNAARGVALHALSETESAQAYSQP